MLKHFAFQWHITDACDQRCKHCYIFSENICKKIETVTYSQIIDIVEKCKDFCHHFNRLPHFSITGGDPLLHPEFGRLLDLLKRENISFSIMGNPFHLTEDVCRMLKKQGCVRYQMSLDGMEKTHDWFRKSGSFRETLEKLSYLRQAGIQSVIMTTVSEKNIHEIPDIIDTVVQYKADIFSFARYCPVGHDNKNGISPQEYRQLLAQCDKKFKYYRNQQVSTYFNLKDHLWTLYRYETGEFKIPAEADPNLIYGGCNCGNRHLTLLPNGDIYACRRFDSKVGNIFTDDLVQVWLNKMEQYRMYQAFDKCSKCVLLAWCRGCPAVAHGTTGSFYAPDPQCWKD